MFLFHKNRLPKAAGVSPGEMAALPHAVAGMIRGADWTPSQAATLLGRFTSAKADDRASGRCGTLSHTLPPSSPGDATKGFRALWNTPNGGDFGSPLWMPHRPGLRGRDRANVPALDDGQGGRPWMR